MRSIRWLSVVAVSLMVALPLAASDGLRQDGAAYAKAYGVSLDEAMRRLRLQRVVSELEGAVAEAEADSFAGMWIEHTPAFRVVARFTNRAAGERLRARVASGPLAGIVETRGAKWSLAELEKQQKDAHERANQAAASESRIDVVNNRVEVITLDERKVSANVPADVAVRRVAKLSSPEYELIPMPGGSMITEGTAGFGVISRNDEIGMSTSGHLTNDIYYQGVYLPFRAEKVSGDHDVQWVSTCDRVYVNNQIYTGSDFRAIHSTMHRNYQTIGTFLCKYGKTTKQTCGEIRDKNIALQAGFNNTGIRVDNVLGNDLSSDGDSGGPWFLNDIAYGIHYGEWGGDKNDALYMAINYLGALYVSVLTYDPGPVCNLRPVSHFVWSRAGFTSWTFDATRSYDPDGSIVSYTWDFDDGSIITTTSPTITHSFGGGEYYITLTVTDNEGKTQSSSNILKTCGGFGQPQCPY